MLRNLIKAAFLLTLIVAFESLFASAAANTVPETGLSDQTSVVSFNDLKPDECAGYTLNNLVTGSGAFDGTTADDLILGSASADVINGRQGLDCIVGGDGNDDLSGGVGTGIDILLGGAGNDALNGGPGDDILYGDDGDDILNGLSGTDTCYGGAGTDTFIQCETIIDP